MMDTSVRVALIADVFPPLRSSGAVQLRDLSIEMVSQGYSVTVLIPSPDLEVPWRIDYLNGVEVLRLKAPKTKDIGYVRRTIGEFFMPFIMLKNFRKSSLAAVTWHGVVWYAPTIFLGPLANALKRSSGCRSYLIVRDIFPEWAVDMGLLKRGLPYRFFKLVERYQYSVADVIGVQTPGNLPYLAGWKKSPNRRLEVLQNWLADAANVGCSVQLAETPIAGRITFVYAGNMGVAQGMGILLDLAASLVGRKDIGFVFVGRGSDAQLLRNDAKRRNLDNVIFYDEIDPTEIAGLYAQCHIGLVALDQRHKTHNIPGKFLSYMQAGLPVLACINQGNDLEKTIITEDVGLVSTEYSVETLGQLAKRLVDRVVYDQEVLSKNCRALSIKHFSSRRAVKQIMAALRA